MLNYRAPRWMPGGHAQTIWPALWSRRTSGHLSPLRRERWATPDGDFVDVDFLSASTPATPSTPLLVLFHGLEGSSRSHYAQAFACAVHERGWHFALPHFRGCSGEPNRAPRAYHSGDHEEIAWLLRRMDNAFFWAVFSGLYGLCFGGLCAAVYLFAKTPAFALSWWLSGLSYDALHGVGNFVLMLLLYRPLRRALQMAKKQLRV